MFGREVVNLLYLFVRTLVVFSEKTLEAKKMQNKHNKKHGNKKNTMKVASKALLVASMTDSKRARLGSN